MNIATFAVLFALAAPGISLAQEKPAAPKQTAPASETVKSKDGTSIAFDKQGKGPVLVLVAGALSDRSGASSLAKLLAPHFTVVNYDRRGRGGSGDTQPYAVKREIEDIEALIETCGGAAFLFGHSSGAALAVEAANSLPAKVTAIAVYEPPYIVDDSRAPIRDGLFDEMGAHVKADRRGDAVALFMTQGVGVPEADVAKMRASPMWAGLEKLAHTLPYDGAILAGLQAGKPLPKDRWTALRARTLVLDGEKSPPFLRNSALALSAVVRDAKHKTIEGQDHSIVFSGPKTLVPVLTEFFGVAAAKPVEAGAK